MDNQNIKTDLGAAVPSEGAKTALPDGGPAFPNEGFNGWGEPFSGMTLRDYFAAKALPILLELENTGVWNQAMGDECRRDHARNVAMATYFMADAMLKARQS